jgi:hypothetical protein
LVGKLKRVLVKKTWAPDEFAGKILNYAGKSEKLAGKCSIPAGKVVNSAGKRATQKESTSK